MEKRANRGNGKGEMQKGRERSMSLPAALHFNQEIAHYSKLKQYDLACASFEKMIQSGVPPDVVTYNTMINVFVKSLRLEDAFRLFNEMKTRNIDPTIVTYTSLIDGCGKCNKFEHALMLYHDVRGSGIALNMHFFNAILNAGLLNGNTSIIESILNDIYASRLFPNTVTFNTLLSGFARFDQLSRMRPIVEKMISLGVEFSPVTQTTILQAAQLVRDSCDLKMFIELLDASNILPSKNQASQAVMDLINAKRLHMAQQLLSTFINKGCYVNEEVYQNLIRLAGEFGNIESLKWISELCNSIGIQSTADVLIAKLDAYACFGDLSRIREILPQVSHYKDQITTGVRIRIIQSFLAAGDIKSAQLMAEEIFNSKKALTSQETDKLLGLFFGKDMNEDVLRLYMQRIFSQQPIGQKGSDFVILSSLKLQLNQLIVDAFFSLKPSIVVITDLAKQIPPALYSRVSWIQMIKSIDTIPPSFAVSQLMNQMMNHKSNDVVVFAFKHFLKIGFEVDEVSVSIAMNALSPSSSFDDHMLVFNSARDSGIELRSEWCSKVLLSALETGNIAEALSIKEEAQLLDIPLSPQALSLFSSNFNTVKFALPSMEGMKSKLPSFRTRSRSYNCPRIDSSDSTYDDIHSYNPFIIMNDIHFS